ncbi:putative dioxygenase Rieske iron-sulfur component [Cylindrospermum sp. NIES-4074]|nr:putative dioxygenase Rieske iron-sulfur component [Cylindrospermum sp. NIES-4074]
MKLFNHWYIACKSQELRQKPLAITILEIPLVLFRGINGKPAALLDRCPHRNVPLSVGWVKNNQLICKYHGWRFNEQGICQEIPGLCTQKEDNNCNVLAYPVIEQDNFIWVYCQANNQPKSAPYTFPYINHKGYSSFSWQMECKTSLENAAENFLDATHTHFVHSALIRSNAKRQEVTVKITRQTNMVEAVYLDEKGISGLIYKLLAPGCKNVVSIGRFILPSIAQLEYSTDNNYKLFISLFITPIRENLMRAYTVVTFRWGLPNWLGRVIAQPLFLKAAQQDQEILELQSTNINLFQGEKFVFTEIDVLRPHISYLLRKSEDETTDERVFEKMVRMRV